MTRSRIFLAAADEELRRKIKNILMKEGFIVIGETGDGSSALRMIRTLDVDLIILDADLPGVKGFEIARIIKEERIAPVVVMSNSWQKTCRKSKRNTDESFESHRGRGLPQNSAPKYG
ncbi:MAG TPA: hypothetical protein DEA47_00665 [Peptococcaceae bacterium]|nr:hypothetical protein [Peptococcaceae bacterium]